MSSAGKVDVVGVHLADDDDPAQAELARLLEHASRIDPEARVGVDDDGRGVDGVQGADRLADEVGIAGRVDQVEVLAGVIEMNQRRFDRVVVVLFFFVEIADARAVVDAGRPLDRSGGGENVVCQRGLSGRSMATKSNVADVLDLALRHAW